MAGLARRLLPSVAAVVLIAVLVSRLGVGPFVRAAQTLDVRTVAVALAIGALTTLASAWRWVRAARGLGLTLERRRAVGDYYAALFLNGVLPGGVLGDVQRAVRHGREARNQRRAVTAVLVERSAGQIVLVLAAVTCVLLRPSVLPAHLVPGRPVLVAVLVLAIVAGALVLLARSRRLVGPGDAAAVLGASVVVLAGHLAMFVVAARAAGSAASVLSLLPLMLVALLAMSLPLNIAGWGPREGVTAWAFASAGMQAGQGLTVAVLYGLLALVASLPGAAVLAVRFMVPTLSPAARPAARRSGPRPVV